jgi:small subunit ribosomal protein S18
MARKRTIRRRVLKNVPKECYFCAEKKSPSFEDASVLGRFTTERGKIIPRSRSGLCGKHQKELAKNVKYARHLALMPFVARG